MPFLPPNQQHHALKGSVTAEVTIKLKTSDTDKLAPLRAYHITDPHNTISYGHFPTEFQLASYRFDSVLLLRLRNDLPPGLRRPGLTLDSFRQSLKSHLFGGQSAQ